MLDTDGMIATAQVLLIDPSRSELTMVSAGHPPPLLRLPDGRVERLPEATHPPLGVGDGAGVAVHVAFPPGACVLGYTDGLVERRGEAIDDGITRLAAGVRGDERVRVGRRQQRPARDGTRWRGPGQRRRRGRRRPAPAPHLTARHLARPEAQSRAA